MKNIFTCPHCSGPHNLSQCPTWRGIYGNKVATPSAQQAAGSIDTPEFQALLPDDLARFRRDEITAHIHAWARAATPAQPIAPTEPSGPATQEDLGAHTQAQLEDILLRFGFWRPDDVKARIAAFTAQPIAVSAPTDERALFEVSMADIFPNVTLNRFPQSDNYNIDWVQRRWEGWQAARAAAPVSGPTGAVLDKLCARIKEMQGAAYTFGEYSEEAVCAALDGVLDEIEVISAAPVSGQGASLPLPAELIHDLRDAIAAARDRAEFARSHSRVKRWDDVLARLNDEVAIDSRPRSEDSRALRDSLTAVDAQLVAILNGADGSVYSKLKAARDDLVRIWLPLGNRALASTTPQKADDE